MLCGALWCLVLPCVALCCLVLPCVALWCLVLPCVALWCLVLPCGALWCLGVFILTPAAPFDGMHARIEVPKGQNAPKRPQTTFVLWLKDNKERISGELHTQYPGMVVGYGAVMKEARIQWQLLSDAEKTPYLMIVSCWSALCRL